MPQQSCELYKKIKTHILERKITRRSTSTSEAIENELYREIVIKYAKQARLMYGN